jgi:hypothetical protein
LSIDNIICANKSAPHGNSVAARLLGDMPSLEERSACV